MTDTRGLVGSRRLVALQTLDIGRLTSTPVYLAPSSLIAVTGRGPTDSNESSKTTLFAAASLLLGDPAWRLDASVTGQHAARLLFDPDNAPDEGNYRADHGYIVGVFAGAEGLFDTSATTVWMRINRRPDPAYLQVRVVDGVALATGDTQSERRTDADRRWAELPSAPTYGQQTFATALYGPASACLSYVDTRGGRKEQRDRSLLGSDLSQLSPTQIAAELIGLSGFTPRFEQERDQRAAFVHERERVDELAGEVGQAKQTYELALQAKQEAEELTGALATAVELRRTAVAAAVVEVSDELTAARARLRELEADVAAATELEQEARTALSELDASDLDAALAQAGEDVGRAKRAFDEAAGVADDARLRLREAETTQGQAAEAAAGWDGTPVAAARAAVTDAAGAHRETVEAVGVARRTHRDATDALAAVESGDAGGVVARLREAGVEARLLADEVEVADHARDRWEALLAPLGDAVAVPPDHADAAARALAGLPGTVVACGHGPLPDGITAAPDGAAGLLATLDGLGGGFDGTTVTLGPGAFVVAGFDSPTLGRAAREQLARVAVERAATQLGRAAELEADAEAAVTDAQAVLEAARAQEQLPGLKAELEGARIALEQASAAAGQAHEDWERQLQVRAAIKARYDAAAEVRSRAEGELEAAREATAEATSMANVYRSNDVRRLRVGTWARRLAALAGDAVPADPQLCDRVDRPADTVELDDVGAVRAWAADVVGDVDRSASTLRRTARDQLLGPVLHHGLAVQVAQKVTGGRPVSTVTAPEGLSEHLVEATRRFVDAGEVAGADPTAAAMVQDDVFDELARLVAHEADRRLRLATQRTTTAQEQWSRLQRNHDEAADELHNQRLQLENQMAALEELARTLFTTISKRFHQIRVRDGGWGAALEVTHHRPNIDDDDPGAEWVWQVEPRWARRGPDPTTGRTTLVPYQRDANTAQYKLATIQLALAALTASTDPAGRVLILDELGNDLGADHREKVVTALAKAAEDAELTVLATVQDDLQPVAFRHAGEVLVLHYPSKADLLNAPTKMLGVDRTRGRIVGPLADLLAGGERDPGWRELWAVYDPATDPTVTAAGDTAAGARTEP